MIFHNKERLYITAFKQIYIASKVRLIILENYTTEYVFSQRELITIFRMSILFVIDRNVLQG